MHASQQALQIHADGLHYIWKASKDTLGTRIHVDQLSWCKAGTAPLPGWMYVISGTLHDHGIGGSLQLLGHFTTCEFTRHVLHPHSTSSSCTLTAGLEDEYMDVCTRALPHVSCPRYRCISLKTTGVRESSDTRLYVPLEPQFLQAGHVNSPLVTVWAAQV